MRNILFICILTLLGLPVLAQEQSCPVKITDVRNVAMTVTVFFTNTSQTAIDRAEFVVALVDSNGGEHYLPVIESRKRLNPGENGTAFISGSAPHLAAEQAQAYLLDVTFDDGSLWSDDGSHSCSLSALQE
jgi:hypothetical protein